MTNESAEEADARVLFSSAAYATESDTEVDAQASAWLEEQAQHPFMQRTAAVSLEGLALQPGDRVLDVGCGTGVLLPALAAAVGPSGRVVGLDHSEAFLARARERVDRLGVGETVELHHGDAHHLPFDDGSFDAAHTERVLMHLEDPDAAVREMVRVVRPGGRVVSAEIHLDGSDYDHPDLDALEQLYAAMGRFRNPRAGIQLRGRFVEAGLETPPPTVVVDVEEIAQPDELAAIRQTAQELAQDPTVDGARLVQAAEAAADLSETGRHCAYALMFVAVGRVPASQR